MTKEARQVIESNPRYKDFTLLDEPISIEQLCEDKSNINVNVYDTTVFEAGDHKYTVGFAGSFMYNNGEIIPLDGDSYNHDMHIWGYRWKGDTVGILTSDW